jgi:hypothetical protein
MVTRLRWAAEKSFTVMDLVFMSVQQLKQKLKPVSVGLKNYSLVKFA